MRRNIDIDSTYVKIFLHFSTLFRCLIENARWDILLHFALYMPNTCIHSLIECFVFRFGKMMDQEPVSDKIVDAILREQADVYIPWDWRINSLVRE